MINTKQFIQYVITPTLRKLDEEMCTASAINLLVGTCAQESKMCTYVKQINGPAVGPYQCEPLTYRTVIDYLNRESKKDLKDKVLKVCGYSELPDVYRLSSDFAFATIIARLHYWLVPESLPEAHDIYALAQYWKKYYNTHLGKGTLEEFVTNYRTYA